MPGMQYQIVQTSKKLLKLFFMYSFARLNRTVLLFISTESIYLLHILGYVEWGTKITKLFDHFLCSFYCFVAAQWIHRCWLLYVWSKQVLAPWLFWYSQTKMKMIFPFLFCIFARISICHIKCSRWPLMQKNCYFLFVYVLMYFEDTVS